MDLDWDKMMVNRMGLNLVQLKALLMAVTMVYDSYLDCYLEQSCRLESNWLKDKHLVDK